MSSLTAPVSAPVPPAAPTAWDVVLFPTVRAAGPADRLSPRAAFQEALHERVLLVDLRDAAARARQGELAAALDAQRLSAAEVADWLAADAGVTGVVLVSGHGVSSAGAVRWLRRRHPEVAVRDVTGGFEAWRRAGMPVAG